MKQFIVETSARHVHVTQQDLETLFGKGYELTVKKMLSQPGQYASAERVDVVGPKKTLTGVSILGPVRSATQVELSLTDARSIGVTAPVRESGDIAGSGACKLVGPAGEVELTEGVIAAKRHIHMTPADAEEYASFPMTGKGRGIGLNINGGLLMNFTNSPYERRTSALVASSFAATACAFVIAVFNASNVAEV